MKRFLRAVGFVVLAGMASGVMAQERPILIAVAANFYGTLKPLAQQFAQQSGVQVKLSTGSTGMLYAQILRGAPFDLFFAADALRPQKLEQQGKIVPHSRQTYALGQLAVWSPEPQRISPNLSQWQGVPKGGRYVSIANPKTAPYGVAAQQALQRLKLWHPLVQQHRLLRGESVGKAYHYVASGHAQVGLVAYAYLVSKPASQVWRVPANWYAPIQQQRVILKGHQRPEVVQFLHWLSQTAQQRRLIQAGYRLPAEALSS